MLLLRHASAGERLSSPSLDRARPLDGVGRAQAAHLSTMLSSDPLERIVSSPHVRCVETGAELARTLGVVVELRSELEPGATKRETLALLRTLSSASLACSHREVFERLFDGNITCEKGGAWILERRGSRFVPGAYVPPPVRIRRARRRAALV